MKEEKTDVLPERSERVVGNLLHQAYISLSSQIHNVLVDLPFIRPDELSSHCKSKMEIVKLLCSKRHVILAAIKTEKVVQ